VVALASIRVLPRHEISLLLPDVSAIALAAVVALIGPGAYSVDARLFGMREIVIARSDLLDK
jgi:hypothetical protein